MAVIRDLTSRMVLLHLVPPTLHQVWTAAILLPVAIPVVANHILIRLLFHLQRTDCCLKEQSTLRLVPVRD